MAQAATAAPAASLAARRAVGGKTVRAATAPVRPVRAARGAPLKCDAIFDQLKSGFDGLLKGDPGEKTRVRYQARLDAINAMGPAMSKLSDDDLRAKTAELQQKVRGGADLDSILVEAFAVSRNATVFWGFDGRQQRGTFRAFGLFFHRLFGNCGFFATMVRQINCLSPSFTRALYSQSRGSSGDEPHITSPLQKTYTIHDLPALSDSSQTSSQSTKPPTNSLRRLHQKHKHRWCARRRTACWVCAHSTCSSWAGEIVHPHSHHPHPPPRVRINRRRRRRRFDSLCSKPIATTNV